jgi:hypothetical protein
MTAALDSMKRLIRTIQLFLTPLVLNTTHNTAQSTCCGTQVQIAAVEHLSRKHGYC